MINQRIANIFKQVAAFLEMDAVPFKPIAYRRAAWGIEALEEDASDIYKTGSLKALEEISGVGKDLALKIEEYIKTGKVKELERLKKKTPVDVLNLTRVEGVGVKTVKKLYEALGIKTLEDLEKAAKAKRIQALPGFDVKKEENILKGLEFLKKEHGRILLSEAWTLAQSLKNKLEKQSEVKKIEVAGSLRRMKETIGDIDVLAVSDNPKKTAEAFASLSDVEEVYAKGSSKTMVRLKNGIDADLRIFGEDEFGAAMQYFTGSKEHNVALRTIAAKKGYKLNEYGLFKTENLKLKTKNWIKIAGENEKGIYEKLGLEYIEPEMRENTGEIEAAQKGKLPKLIKYGSLKGDLQIHTDWSDGEHSLREMAEAAIDAGLSYIGITNHSKSLQVAGGLDEKRLEKQFDEIDASNKTYKEKLTILKSAEVDILKDGSLDMSNELLSRLDYALVTVHTHAKITQSEMTDRIVEALKNPYVDILGHPTGRLVLKRKAYEVDIDEVMKAAKVYGVAMEINAHPERLDIKDTYIREAVRMGVKLVISSDAHHKAHYTFLRFGVAQARRGWTTSENVINTLPLKEFLKRLRRNNKK